MMKIRLHSEQSARLSIMVAGEEYTLFAGDCVSLNIPDDQPVQIEMRKEKSARKSFGAYLAIFPWRIVRSVFDIILYNVPDNFVKRIEPYSFSGCAEIRPRQGKSVKVKYQPSKYIEQENAVKIPTLEIDGEPVALNTEFDENCIHRAFGEYCLSCAAICFDVTVFFVVLYIAADRRDYWWLWLLLMFLLVVMPGWKMHKEYRRMKRIRKLLISPKI